MDNILNQSRRISLKFFCLVGVEFGIVPANILANMQDQYQHLLQ